MAMVVMVCTAHALSLSLSLSFLGFRTLKFSNLISYQNLMTLLCIRKSKKLIEVQVSLYIQQIFLLKKERKKERSFI